LNFQNSFNRNRTTCALCSHQTPSILCFKYARNAFAAAPALGGLYRPALLAETEGGRSAAKGRKLKWRKKRKEGKD